MMMDEARLVIAVDITSAGAHATEDGHLQRDIAVTIIDCHPAWMREGRNEATWATLGLFSVAGVAAAGPPAE